MRNHAEARRYLVAAQDTVAALPVASRERGRCLLPKSLFQALP